MDISQTRNGWVIMLDGEQLTIIDRDNQDRFRAADYMTTATLLLELIQFNDKLRDCCKAFAVHCNECETERDGIRCDCVCESCHLCNVLLVPKS